MAPNPEQIPSRTCGCPDCLIDLPPDRYGYRPPRATCQGPWLVRYREDGVHRRKPFSTLSAAHQFLAATAPRGERHAS